MPVTKIGELYSIRCDDCQREWATVNEFDISAELNEAKACDWEVEYVTNEPFCLVACPQCVEDRRLLERTAQEGIK